MKDEDKTKDQLINELAEMRQQITELETSEVKRRRTEEALRKSEEKFRLAFENANDAIFWADHETGLIINCNKAAEILLEKKTEEIIGYHQTIIHPPRKAKYYTNMFKKHIGEQKQAVVEEAEVITKSGKIKPVDITASISIVGGKPIIQRIFRNITEHKRSEEVLQESEKKFRDLAEKSLVGVYLIQDGIFKYVNSRLAEIFGYTVEELIDKRGPRDVTLPEDWHIVEDNLRKRVSGKVESINYAFRGRTKNKELIYIEVYGSRTVYQSQPAVIGTLLDITERRRAEVALRESEEKYRRLFEESKDVVLITTPEGKLVDINPAGVELFGYPSKEDLLKVDIGQDLYFNPQDRENYRQAMSQQGLVKDYELVLKKKDGQLIIVVVTANAARDDKGNIVAYRGIMRNVTEQRQLEQQLLQSQKMEAIGRLAGGIAHDFNNLLTAIQGYTDLAMIKVDETDPLYRDLKQVHLVAARAASLTRQLLLFSRKQPMEFVPLNINKTVDDLLKMLNRLIGEDIVIDTDLEPDLWTVQADAGNIEQVIMNLSVNAKDAIPEGGTLTIKTKNVILDKEHCKVIPEPKSTA